MVVKDQETFYISFRGVKTFELKNNSVCDY